MSGWAQKPLATLGAALRERKVTPLDLYEECRAAHERHGGALDAYRVWDEAYARELAEAAGKALAEGRDAGPLMGIPVSAKDLFGLARFDTFAGSPKALPDAWCAEGPFVRAVLDQGAVITGKTHQVEFAFGGLGMNAHWPIPRNPWDAKDHRVCGGSSTGAGVTLIGGSARLALGSDTAGSVRVPASMTGTVGLKVTAGRWPLEGIVPLSPTLDTPGILARSAADAKYAFAGIDPRCSGRKAGAGIEAAVITGLRVGVPEKHFWDECPDDISSVVRGALGELEKAGARIVSFDLAETADAYNLFRQGSVVSSELRTFLESELPGWIETLDPVISYRLDGALALDSKEIAARRTRMADLTAKANEHIREVDVLVSPTVPITAPKVAEVTDVKDYAAANGRALRNTCIANILGLCAMTLPAGLDGAGIPVGLQLMAPGNTEERLLSIALAFEQVLGTPRERLGKAPLGT